MSNTDFKALKRHLDEFSDLKERRVRSVATPKLMTYLKAFGFETRQNGSHINFQHERFSEITGVIVQGSEKRDYYLSVIDACERVHEKLLSESVSDLLSDMFDDHSDSDIDHDFQSWGEEIPLDNGRVILRAQKWSCIGAIIEDTPEARAAIIPTLNERQRSFAALSYQMANKYGMGIRKVDDVFEYYVSAYEYTKSLSVFSPDHINDQPEAFLVDLQADVTKRIEALKPAMDSLIHDSGALTNGSHNKDKDGDTVSMYRTYAGPYAAGVRVFSRNDNFYVPNVFSTLCNGINTVFSKILSGKNLRKIGFNVNHTATGLRGQHKFYPDIAFELPDINTSFPTEVLNNTFQDMPPEDIFSISQQAVEHVQGVMSATKDLRAALSSMHERASKDVSLVRKKWGLFDSSLESKARLGEPCWVTITPGNGEFGSHRLRVIFIPNDIHFDTKIEDANIVFDPDALNDFKTSVMRAFQRLEAPNDGGDPLGGLSGLKPVRQRGTVLHTGFPAPKPPWEGD